MPFCDNCRFSEFDFTDDILLRCLKDHRVAFFTPSTYDAHLNDRRWGWHYILDPISPQPRSCPDFVNNLHPVTEPTL